MNIHLHIKIGAYLFDADWDSRINSWGFFADRHNGTSHRAVSVRWLKAALRFQKTLDTSDRSLA